MTSWFAQPLTGRPDGGFTVYAWADHTGWHFEAQPPECVVPTGHVWAWGEHDWATWREDPDRCVGIWARRAEAKPGDGWVEAEVEEPQVVGEARDETPRHLPSLHQDKRFFRADTGEANWHCLPARIIRITSPARVDLFDCLLG